MKWTLVTGGAKRLGAELCVYLAEQGYSIIVHYHRSKKEALEVAARCQEKGVQAATIAGDFSSSETTMDFVSRYTDEFPETENLINNVGNYIIKSALQTNLKEWTDLFQTNFFTPINTFAYQYIFLLLKKNIITTLYISVQNLNNC